MNLLAIDTSTSICAVCLDVAGVRTLRDLKGVEKASGQVLGLCDEVFTEANFDKNQLDGIIYTKGPGSFTGVRMGVSVVQGLALALKIPTYGISTLANMGHAAAKKYQVKKVAMALDARMGEVYWGWWEEGKLKGESLKNPDEVEVLGPDFFGVGSGFSAYDGLAKSAGIIDFAADFYPNAGGLIDLATIYYQQNGKFSDQLPLPTYLRNNVVQNC